MPKRCPPGVLCVENVTIMFICVIFIAVGLFVYMRSGSNMRSGGMRSGSNMLYMHKGNMPNGNMHHNMHHNMHNGIPIGMPRKGRGDDVFYDIYQPPLRNDSCGITGGSLDIRGDVNVRGGCGGGMPINVSTQQCGNDAPYRQIGILTRTNGETILPLMGRPLFTRRDKWNFYTLNDKNNMIKLPIRFNGRDATDEIGVDNVYTGDIVYVEGYNESFKVTAYNNQLMRYLPNNL